ncbi:Flp family type IVb pilin [Arthrobacter sp. NPDC058130]|uniref:Flp family type IVb pilin n=1 Tax=Arthrobacter sp. NPDC058130 TaxID=3346353 RepID=UPI0036E19B84
MPPFSFQKSSINIHCAVDCGRANVVPTKLQQIGKGDLPEIRSLFKTLEKEKKMTGLMVSMLAFVSGVKNKLTGEEKGATAVEYGIMVALIAVVIIGAVSAFGTSLFNLFNQVTTGIGGTPAP